MDQRVLSGCLAAVLTLSGCGRTDLLAFGVDEISGGTTTELEGGAGASRGGAAGMDNANGARSGRGGETSNGTGGVAAGRGGSAGRGVNAGGAGNGGFAAGGAASGGLNAGGAGTGGFAASGGVASGNAGTGGFAASGGVASGGAGNGGFAAGGAASGGVASGGAGNGGFGFGGASAGGSPAAGAAGAAPMCDPNAGLIAGSSGCVPVAPPRLIGPLSTATVTSRRPTLRFELPNGSDSSRVEICSDRACQHRLMALDGVTAVVPTNDLPKGVVYWRAFGKSGSVTGRTASSTWQFIVPARSAPVDTSWGTTLDANGDGYADVIIGAPDVGASGSPPSPAGTGHAFLYLGSSGGLITEPATTLVGPDGTNSRFGTSVASAGDVNGDGFADVIVGATGPNANAGKAYLYLGGPKGLAGSPARTLLGPADKGAQFGASVTSAGDLNGDGYADVVIGAPLHGFTLGFYQYQGAAYVYFGSASGLPPTPSLTLNGPEQLGTNFGSVVASAGDANGDGYGDLVVAGTAYVAAGGSSYTGSHSFYVFPGSAFGPASLPAFTLSDQNWISTSVAGDLDLNGDGYADLAIGALGENSADLYYGGPGGFAVPASAHLAAQRGSDGYNYRVTRAGDIDGDGYQELLASQDDVFMYAGSANGLKDAPVSFVPTGSPSPSVYGFFINQVGDFDGDGYGDVVIGAKFDHNFTGRAYVYMGTALGLASEPAAVLVGPDGPGGDFG